MKRRRALRKSRLIRRRALRESRLVHAAVGASVLAAPASAAALGGTAHDGAGQGPAAGPAAPAIQARLSSKKIGYGRDVVAVGQAPSSQDGQTVDLEFARSHSAAWTQIASGRVGANGRFRLAARLWSSGTVRVIAGSQASSLGQVSGTPIAQSAAADSSAPQDVLVRAALRIRHRSFAALGERRVEVRGRLLPASPGRTVLLQAQGGGRWHTLTSARTSGHGRFDLRYLAAALGQEPLRVRFAGDRTNAAVSRRAGVVTVYHQTVASWYDDGGTTGCGFHAYYGVANVSLPCGTQVSFMYGGRQVTATVDDRGPYVGGRTWDLNQNTAAALGFAGVGAVWSSS
jgi:hypothetical protein